MILYRMSKRINADDLSGRGAEIAGGRWNRKGLPALYLAGNRSTALVETIVHCRYIEDLYDRLVLSIEIPAGMADSFDTGRLPDNWNATPWINDTIDMGSQWLRSHDNLILQLPSSVIPEEKIYMINPRHSEFKRVKIAVREVFKADNRLVLME